MLSLYDSRRRESAVLGPRRGRELRLLACGPAAARPAHVGDLRALVLADLVRRTAESHRLAVTACLASRDPRDDPGGAGAEPDSLAGDSLALNVRPPEQSRLIPAAGPPGEAPGPASGSAGPTAEAAGEAAARLLEAGRACLDGVVDVAIVPAGLDAPPGEDALLGHWVQAGPVRLEGREPDAAPVPLAALTGRGLDPLALRLAYLEHGYREPAELTWSMLGNADTALRGWRKQVAEWANLPSRPLDRAAATAVSDAFDADLDTPAALAALRGLAADAGIPEGARFEVFAHVDQLLALDLTRDIGRF